MITSLTLSYELIDSDIGYVIGNHENVKAGDSIPLYIPKIMSSIERSDKMKKEIVAVDCSAYIFSNAKECRPALSTTIKTRNYIMAKAQYNSDYSNGLINGQKVSVLFANNSLREIYFNTDIKNENQIINNDTEQQFNFIEHYELRTDFPLVGKENILYVSKKENASYRWDSNDLNYYCIGRDYEEISIIDNGNSNI